MGSVAFACTRERTYYRAISKKLYSQTEGQSTTEPCYMQPASAVQSIHTLQYWSVWVVSKLSLSPVSQRRHSPRKWPTPGKDYDPTPAKSWADCCQEKQHQYCIYNRRLFSQLSPRSGPDYDPLLDKTLGRVLLSRGTNTTPDEEEDTCPNVPPFNRGSSRCAPTFYQCWLKTYSHFRLQVALSCLRTKSKTSWPTFFKNQSQLSVFWLIQRWSEVLSRLGAKTRSNTCKESM